MTPTLILFWSCIAIGAYAAGFSRGYGAGWREMQAVTTTHEGPRP